MPSRYVIQCSHAFIWPTNGYFVNHISIGESKVETNIITNKVPATTNYFTCLNKPICAKLNSGTNGICIFTPANQSKDNPEFMVAHLVAKYDSRPIRLTYDKSTSPSLSMSP